MLFKLYCAAHDLFLFFLGGGCVRRINMPRSFLVKNKRCSSYNIHRSHDDEPEALTCKGKN